MRILKDDRTEEQKKTHPYVVIGRDTFLSGWGGAEGMTSYAGWACTENDSYKVERWVKDRREMRNVRVTSMRERLPRSGHVHIYVVTEGHPALR